MNAFIELTSFSISFLQEGANFENGLPLALFFYFFRTDKYLTLLNY